ncbi:MAG: hypothetical protein J0M10_06595 [Chitinophagales bacterium]|nr:hypothetical protein [Chitinophagales bacterium]
MQSGNKKFILFRAVPLSLLVPAVFLFAFIRLTTPLLNSGDDAFMMYTLAGGYGEPATALLHYNHVWHPWLGGLVKTLFVQFPGINAYVLILLLFNWAGLAAVLYTFLQKLKPAPALLFFVFLFLFVETRIVLSLNLSGTAFVATSGAMVLLVYSLEVKKLFRLPGLLAFLLLMASGMLRLHVTGLVMILFLPPLFFYNRALLFPKGLFVFVSAGILFFGLNRLHQQYYEKQIPGWKQQESFRQSLFYLYNRPLNREGLAATFTGKDEQDLFFAGFLYDSTRFSTAKIKAYGNNMIRRRLLNDPEDREGLYWFFQESRIYLLFFLAGAACLFLAGEKRRIRRWLIALGTVLAVHTGLFILMKLTPPLHFGLLFFLFVTAGMQLEGITGFRKYGRTAPVLFVALFLLLSGWMGVRLYKENQLNESRRHKFICMLDELNRHPEQLFIATDDSFPLGYFSIRDLPRQYPVRNLVYKDRLLTNMYPQTLKRFGYSSVDEAVISEKNVYLLGAPLPALESVYKDYTLSDTLPGYRCLEVRKLERRP